MEFTVVAVKPGKGVRTEDVEFPGAGRYVAVFAVPAWIPGGTGLRVTKRGSFNVSGHKVTHEETDYDADARVARVHVGIESTPETHDPDNQLDTGLTIGSVMRGISGLGLGWLFDNFLQVVVDSLVEVRRVVEIPNVALAGGAGLVLLAIAKG